jgi:hypothetical protein
MMTKVAAWLAASQISVCSSYQPGEPHIVEQSTVLNTTAGSITPPTAI